MVVFLLLIFFFLFLFLFLFHYFMFVANLPPGPTMWQLWLRRHKLATKPHVATKDLADTYGPLLSFRLGGQLVVVASSPAAAEEILKTNNLVFSRRYVPSVYYNIPGSTKLTIHTEKEFLRPSTLSMQELLLAATDSTTITAVWLMAELIKNEEILHKVRNEIAEIAVEGDELNESRLSECSYFEACLKETLRLHIPGPFAVPHRAIESCKVSNYLIPRDSIVVVNSWTIQTDPNVWDDATVFKPERFLDSKIDFKGTHCEYLPFSAGKRMCPGFNVAFKGLMFVVGSLLCHFDWSLPHGENPNELDMSDEFGTSLKMAKPLYLIPKLRIGRVASSIDK